MSEYKVVDDAVNKIRDCVEKYSITYLDVVPYIGHHYVIREVLKNIDFPIVYFVNNTIGEESIKEIKEYLKPLKENGLKYSQGLKTVKKGSITFISATEMDIEEKVKKIDINEPVLLINDCTLTSRAINISKLKNMLQPCKVINLVYNNRLTETENILINTNEVGYVYVNGKEEPNDKFIDGFIVNPTDDLNNNLNINNDLNETLLFAGLNRYKTLASCYTPKGNIIQNKYISANYLVVTKNFNTALYISHKLEEKDDKIGIKIVSSPDEFEKTDLNDRQIIITTNVNYVLTNNKNTFLVITLLEETCDNGVLFNIVKNCYNKELICKTEGDDDYDYKYMYIYDEPSMVKKSLLPVYHYKTPETINNDIRTDIEPFAVKCQTLVSVDYPNFDDDTILKNCVEKSVKEILGQIKNLKTLVNKGLDYTKKPQPILVNSIIYSYLNYDLKVGYYEDNFDNKNYLEATKLLNQAITKHMLAEKYKFNSDKANREKLYNAIKKEILNKNVLYDYNNHKKDGDTHIVDNIFNIMTINDLQNISTSKIIKIAGLTMKYYSDSFKIVPPKRQVVDKTVYFPIMPKFVVKEYKVLVEESYKTPVKYSEVEKIKNGAYIYSKKLKPETERMFMEYLKNSSWVDWWCKNGDLGEPNFSVATVDKKDMPICFYPDWIIKIKDKRLKDMELYLICDTKAGMTLDDSGSTGAKIAALEEWCTTNNISIDNPNRTFLCGIVTFEGGFWKISSNNIDYNIDMDYSNFQTFEDWLDMYFNQLTSRD